MANNLVREVSIKELTSLLEGARPILVAFCAPYYASCEVVNPMLERLAERFAGRVEIVKIDVDKHRTLAAEYAVRGVVTLLLVVGGDIVSRHIGTGGEVSLIILIERHLEKMLLTQLLRVSEP